MKWCSRFAVSCCVAVSILGAAWAAGERFELAAPDADLYYDFVVVAGGDLKVDKQTSIAGNLHANTDAEIKQGATVTGDVSAVGEVDAQGTVSGQIIAGAPALELPAIDLAALRAIADRVFEQDVIFRDAVIDDVVFVAGKATIRDLIEGTGTLVASGGIKVEKGTDPEDKGDSLEVGGDATGSGVLEMSLIALEMIEIKKERFFRGAVRAGGDVKLDKNVIFEGVIVADGEVEIKKEAQLTFVDFDTLAPTIALLAPADGTTIDNATPTVEVALADDFSGLRPETLTFALDGVDRTAEVTATAGGFTFTPSTPLADGLHTIDVSIEDHSDNLATASFSFTVTTDTTPPPDDDEPPRLSLISPTTATVPADTAFNLVVRYVDPVAGVDLSSIAISVDGTGVTASCSLGASSASCPIGGFAVGEHTIVVTAADRAGNAAASSFSLSAVAIADNTAPVIEIASPDGQPRVEGSSLGIVVGYSDSESGVDLGTLEVTLDGTDVTAGCALNTLFATCPGGDLSLGSHSVTAAVSDVAGNASSAVVSFAVEAAAAQPSIAIVAPLAPTFELDPQIVVTYAAAGRPLDPASLLVEVDGVAVACTAAAAQATCDPGILSAGLHNVRARIADLQGLAATASLVVEVLTDLTPPVIVLEAPVDGTGTNDPQVEVRGVASDDNQVAQLTVNGQAVALSGGAFALTVPLSRGANLVGVEAVDQSGNVATVQALVHFPLDDRPPNLTIGSIGGGSFVDQPRPVIDLSFADDNDVDPGSLVVTVNGVAIPVSCSLGALGGRCTPAVDLADGATTLAVRIADVFGNTASASVGFIVDTAGVQVAIAEPATDLATRAASVEVVGTVTPADASVVVGGVAATVAGGGFRATIPLHEGRNTVVAIATKANGNSAGASVEVLRDLQAPIVRIDSPRNGFVSVNDRVPVTGLVNDLIGASLPTVEVGGVPAPVSGGGFMVPEVLLVPGPNVIEAVARDAVGNTGRNSITVFFQPPAGARLGFASGNGQTGSSRQTLAEPLEVVVTDGLGNPQAGRIVRFAVVRNNGVLRRTLLDPPVRVLEVPTDGSGRARVRLTLGETAGEGNNRVRATAVGVAGEVEFCATALPLAADRVLMVGGDNQRGVAGGALPLPLEALVVDAAGNAVPGASVSFEVVRGSGTIDGAGMALRGTGFDGVARAVLTLGREVGVNNHSVRASVAGLTSLQATFVATVLAPGDPARTALAGVVLDNTQAPIPNAAVTINGTTLETVTDASGQFRLDSVPVGPIGLHIDPAASPRAETFPPIEFETVTIAGQVNTIGQPILLPAIDTGNTKVVGGVEDVTLTMEGVDGLTLTVFAGSATFPDGSPTGALSISQVHLDKVPMPPPSGTIFMPPAWTIQPSGVVFDPPARITIPNDGLAPGRVIDIFQFDHPTNRFVNVGKGTVSEDAFQIVSDPGFGIIRSGWGGCGQPPPPDTCVDGCPKCQKCEDGSCVADDGGDPGGVCVDASLGAEASTIQGLVQRALSSVPFVDNVMVEGSFTGEACPVCCNGSVMQAGEITGTGAFTASAEVEKFLSPIDIEKEIEFSIFGFELEFELEFQVGPFIKLSPEISVSGSVSGNRCDGEICTTASGCGGFGVSVGGGVEFEFEVDAGSHDDLIEIEVEATVSASANGSAGVQFSSCDDLFEVTGCIGEIRGDVEIDIFFFPFTVGATFFDGFGECCG